jgi:hypothetical protein
MAKILLTDEKFFDTISKDILAHLVQDEVVNVRLALAKIFSKIITHKSTIYIF